MNGGKIKKSIVFTAISIVLALIVIWKLYDPSLRFTSKSGDINPTSSSFVETSHRGSIVSEYRVLPFDTIVVYAVGPQMPDFRSHIHASLDSAEYGNILVYELDVTRAIDSVFIQAIRDTATTEMATGVELEDIDFDGFLDIVIVSDLDNVGNPSRHFWTFDNNSGRFVFNAEFSERLGGEMVVDPLRKQISTGYRSGMGGGSYTFQVDAGHLTLIEHVSEEQVVVNDTEKTKTTVERLVGGKLTVVEETYDIR